MWGRRTKALEEGLTALAEQHNALLMALKAAEQRLDHLDPDSKDSETSRRWLAGHLIMLADRIAVLEDQAGLSAQEEKLIEKMKAGPNPRKHAEEEQ